ncbi:MAG: EpsG family protein [Clostridium sp.]|uniref:EpsG family protein n=1 Tax=Clostridium sp. TaxID=1506 RepID=UPI00302DC7A7
MKVFYLTLISTYIFSLLARIGRKRSEKAGLFFVIIIIAILSLVSGLRSGIGDTGMYKHLYTLIGPGYDAKGGYEPGFILFLKILKGISSDPQFMLMVTSIIINVLNINTIYKYSKDSYFELGIFMYITSGYYIVTMNGIRQSLAAAIIFWGTKYIINGDFKRFMILILLMSTIHNSALIYIPIYFVVRAKAWERTTNILFGLTLVGLFLYQPVMTIGMKLLGSTRYADYASFNEGGANILRIAIFIVPVLLAYLKRDVIKEKWEYGDVFVNMNIICLIIMLFSSFNWIFARFTMYFQLYSFILLPYIIKNCLVGKERRLIYLGLIGGYFIFFYYDQVITMNMVYKGVFKWEDFFYDNKELSIIWGG